MDAKAYLIKLSLFLFFASVSFTAGELSKKDEDVLFKNYLAKNKITLGWFTHESRKKTFLARYYAIEDHNKDFLSGKTSYQLHANKFSHLSIDELRKKRLGHKARPRSMAEESLGATVSRPAIGGDSVLSDSIPPESFDWNNFQGGSVVRPVQDQLYCSSCWAFASLAALEGQMALKKNSFEVLSVQQVIECARANNQLLGCNGGWDWPAYVFAIDNNGVANSSTDPYLGTTDWRLCQRTMPTSLNSSISSWVSLPSYNETNIRDVLYNVGPLFITIQVTDDFFYYSGGIFTDVNNFCNDWPNHAILLTGFGTEDGIDYWILKNSWGTDWGENGFFRIQRGVGLCGIDLYASYPILP